MMKKTVGFLLFLSFGLLAFAGAPTLKTITVDGDMSDWAPVLANPIQVTVDGATASPCSGSTPVDRDCPVQSTGRDMVKFAWTYDASNIYLYVKRVGSSSNSQTFFFAMNVNQNKRMGAFADHPDYVLVVDWKGSNRSTGIQLYTYLPADSVNGDPLVNASGFADGYSLPGSIGTLVWSDYMKSGGSASGQEMETYVPWLDIGVPYGTPIYYHVSSSNNTKLSTAQDNLGGPGGGLGAFGYYQHTISPDSQGSTAPGGTVSYTHTLSNNGSFPDTYTIGASSSIGYPLSLYVNGSSVTLPATVALDAGASATIRVDVATVASPASAVDTTTISASSAGDGTMVSATDTTYVGTVSLAPNGNATAVPGMAASYSHTLTNLLASDTFNFSVSGSAGWRLDLYEGSTLIATDLNGNGVWDNITTGYDTDGNGLPDLAVANGESQPISLVVTPPAGTPVGATNTATLSAAGVTGGGSASVTDITTVKQRLTVSPSYLISDGTNLYSGAGYPVYFAHTLVNSASTADTFNFYAPGYSPSSSAGYTVTILSDPNGDGNPSDGFPISSTGPVAANGGVFHFIVEVDVPSNILPPATDSTVVTVVRCADAGCTTSDTTVKASVTDETMVSYIVPFMDPIHAVQRSAFAPCETVYMGGYNLIPDTYYYLLYKNNAGSVVRTVNLLADTNGTFSDTYTFPATASGTWMVILQDARGGNLDSVTLTIQRSAAVTLQPAASGLPLAAASVVANAHLADSNSISTYSGSRVNYVVKSPDGTQYLKSDGTWSAYSAGSLTSSHSLTDVGPGASVDDTFSAPSVTFPGYGVYSLCATWESPCGSDSSTADDLAASCTNLYVVSWTSYADAGHTSPSASFEVPAVAYLEGQGYGGSTSYTVALYGPSGSLVTTSTSTSDSSGLLDWSVDTQTLSALGTYHAVVYPAGAAVPSIFSASDTLMLAVQAFDATLSAPALIGPVLDGDTTASGTSSAPAGSLVTLYDNGAPVGTASVQAGGTFTITSSIAFTAGDQLTAIVQVGSATSSPSAPLTVNPPVSLLRYGGVSSLSPLTPSAGSIFVQQYPSDPALDPSRDLEVSGFVSGASFPHESTDMQAGSPPLVFYELSGTSGDTLRVTKSGGKIVITY